MEGHRYNAGMRLAPIGCVLAASLASLCSTLNRQAPAHAQSSQREARRELARLERTSEVDPFLEAFRSVLEEDDRSSVRAALGSYGAFFERAQGKLAAGELLRLHGKAAAAFAKVTAADAVEESRKLLVSHKSWGARLLLLDAAGHCRGLDRMASALAALGDAHPVVVRRAAQYLARAKSLVAADALVERGLEVAKRPPRGSSAGEWSRASLVCLAALREMLHVDLPAAEDYKSYLGARRGDPRLFEEPPLTSGDSKTGLTLFGAAITGKNLAFIIDVSGSMETTDPYPPGEEPRARAQTVVGDGSRERELERRRFIEERQRMSRARRELAKVVRALGSDMRFNIIAYSSDVQPWRKSLVPASDANRKSAVEYIEGLRPAGITVTDMALEDAFSDLEVDTIYLITDGAPTHLGSAGPGLPEDSTELIRQIHARVAELNFLRGVRIFTLGFKDAEIDFLEKLAADHLGRCVEIR